MITDYAAADAVMTGRCRQRRKVANNTYLHRLGEQIVLVLHNTAVIVYRPNGLVELHSGGWHTATTKDRLHSYSPDGCRVSQRDGEWFVWWQGQEWPFADGMVLHECGCDYPTGRPTR